MSSRWIRAGDNRQFDRASTPHQEDYIGDQAGGRVFLFRRTDDFWRDYAALKGKGVEFVTEPKESGYGTVVVFRDLYGTLWDLVEFGDGRGDMQPR